MFPSTARFRHRLIGRQPFADPDGSFFIHQTGALQFIPPADFAMFSRR